MEIRDDEDVSQIDVKCTKEEASRGNPACEAYACGVCTCGRTGTACRYAAASAGTVPAGIKSHEGRDMRIIDMITEFLRIYDYIEHTNRLDVFRELFLNKKRRCSDEIAHAVGLSKRSLMRYKKKLTRIFAYFMENYIVLRR